MGKGAKGNQGNREQGKGKPVAEEDDNGWGATWMGSGADNNYDEGGTWGGGMGVLPMSDWDVPEQKPGAPPPPLPPAFKVNPRGGKQQQQPYMPPPVVTLTDTGQGGVTFQPGVPGFHGPGAPATNPIGMGNPYPSAFTSGSRYAPTNAFPPSFPGQPGGKNTFPATSPTSPQNAYHTRFADEQPPAALPFGGSPWPQPPNQPGQGGGDNAPGGKQKGKKQKDNNANQNKYNQNINNPNQKQGKKQKQQNQDSEWDNHAGDTWGYSTKTMVNDDYNPQPPVNNIDTSWNDPPPGGRNVDAWGNEIYNPNGNYDQPQGGGGYQEEKGGKKGKQKGKKNQNDFNNNDSTWQQPNDRSYEKNDDGGWGVQGNSWEEPGSAGLGLGGGWDQQALPTMVPPMIPQGDIHGYRSPVVPRAVTVDHKDPTPVKIEESGGKGLETAQHALYGTHRVAEARFMWILPYQHDPRVVWMIDHFIPQSSEALATLGFRKYLRSREKGALIVNVDYTSKKRPSEPAFDWVVFSDIQKTRDRTLQQQIITNNPANTCLVFVFLVSKSGNSLGIWRRKLTVPHSLQSTHQAQIRAVEADLRDKVYIVKVDPPMIAGTATDPRLARSRPSTPRSQKTSKLSKLVKWITWGNGGNKIKKAQKPNLAFK